jgi:hypothetical protein
MNEPVLITNWSQFVRTFGDFKECSEHLAHGIYGFFNNGGLALLRRECRRARGCEARGQAGRR